MEIDPSRFSINKLLLLENEPIENGTYLFNLSALLSY